MPHFTIARSVLEAMAKELHILGYETTHIGRLKQKHIEILVKHWQECGVSVGSIKKSHVRFTFCLSRIKSQQCSQK